MIEIGEVDVADETTLRAFWEAEQASHARTTASTPCCGRWHAARARWSRSPNDYFRRTLLVARDGDEVVGAADLGGSLPGQPAPGRPRDPRRCPSGRRRGIGRALDDEASQPARCRRPHQRLRARSTSPGSSGDGVAAYAFAAALGFEACPPRGPPAARPPVAAGPVERLRAKADAGRRTRSSPGADRCPDEHIEAFCDDAHADEHRRPDRRHRRTSRSCVDAERLRAGEQRLFAVLRRHHVGGARGRADGVFGGYSQLYLPHGADYVYQDDTLVMPEHRGHRLGTLLKLATLEVLQREQPGAGRHPHRHRRRQPRRCRRPTATSGSGPSSGCTRCSVAMAEVRPDLWPLLDRGAPVSPVWETDAFADEMRAWCSAVLDRDVQLEVQKIRGWSAVWRVTDGREVWFAKQNCPGQLFEAALLGVLSRLSDRVVPVTAVDPSRGFLLTPDQGPVLADTDGDPVEQWCAVAREGTLFQREVAPHLANLEEAGLRRLGPAEATDVRRDPDRAVRRPARGRPAAAGRGRGGPAAGAAARGGGVGRPAARSRPSAHAGPQRPARLQRLLRRRPDALLRLRRRRARRPACPSCSSWCGR